MFDEFLKKADEMVMVGESFAIATVVRYQAPISGKPGDKAIIFADGEVWGWIGGGCAKPVVVKEALKALEDGRPRLVRISPSSSEEEGIVAYNMTCHSGGTLDVYIEPVLPKPHILILGRSPVGQTLAKLARLINYAVSESPDSGLGELKAGRHSFIVVSTQGDGDEDALETALRTDASYVAFIASKAKAAKVLQSVGERGIAPERLSQVKAPAGINLGAGSPEEIAVSILAEIVQLSRRKLAEKAPATNREVQAVLEAKDPICGMAVNIEKAKHKAEYHGKIFYFCCAGCKQSFEKVRTRLPIHQEPR